MSIQAYSTARPAFLVGGVARPSLDAGLIGLLIEDSLTGPSSWWQALRRITERCERPGLRL
jgi:hypothetical protein